jgi:hypothetical protein
VRYLSILILILLADPAVAQKTEVRLKNQVSAWSSFNKSSRTGYKLGMRYVPDLSVADTLKNGNVLDAEFSVNAYGNLAFSGSRFDSAGKELNLYRFWIRYSGKRFEIRLGLQKISFGSAAILRPLMWFDRMDFRDPLQLTTGVYGALGRYYFKNNINLWTWVLYGENKIKGWESAPSKTGSPEFGGRLQIPAGNGEMGLSFHHREEDYSAFYSIIPHFGPLHYPENRIGFDGKWDLGPGVWYELVAKHNNPDNGILGEWETYINLGADYTFGIGNGLNFTSEYFRYGSGPGLYTGRKSLNFSALAANYPFGLMNKITGAVYYNWTDKGWYRFINVERSYDFWSFYLMLFWNPQTFYLYGNATGNTMMAGKGVQVMAVVNF